MKKIIYLALMSSLTFAATLKVEVKNIKTSNGKIGFAIFDRNNASGFPKDHTRAVYRDFLKVNELPLEVDLPTGDYAITIFHDVNNNNDLDTNGIGIPKEPFGFSNNPKILFGPPKFNKAKVKLGSGGKKTSINLMTF